MTVHNLIPRLLRDCQHNITHAKAQLQQINPHTDHDNYLTQFRYLIDLETHRKHLTEHGRTLTATSAEELWQRRKRTP